MGIGGGLGCGICRGSIALIDTRLDCGIVRFGRSVRLFNPVQGDGVDAAAVAGDVRRLMPRSAARQVNGQRAQGKNKVQFHKWKDGVGQTSGDLAAPVQCLLRPRGIEGHGALISQPLFSLGSREKPCSRRVLGMFPSGFLESVFLIIRNPKIEEQE